MDSKPDDAGPMKRRRRLAVESPYKGNADLNMAYARNICRYAVDHDRNPYAMHLFFTQFLDDQLAGERAVGIECGLAWTDLAEEVWFCLRPGETLSEGMLHALRRQREVWPDRPILFLRFNQDGSLIEESDATAMGA